MGAVVNEHLSYVIDEQGHWIFQDPTATTTTALPTDPVSVEVYGNPMFNYILGSIVFLIALYFARPMINRLTDGSQIPKDIKRRFKGVFGNLAPGDGDENNGSNDSEQTDSSSFIPR